MRKAVKWFGLVSCSVAAGMISAIYGIGALLCLLIALSGFAVWCMADFKDEMEKTIEEVADAVAEALLEEIPKDEYEIKIKL